MKTKNKFKDFKYTCLKCHSVFHISVYLCHNKCVICDKPLSKRLKRQMRKTLIKNFVKYSKNDRKRQRQRNKTTNKIVSQRILFIKLKEKLNKQYLKMFKEEKYCFFCSSFIENPKLKYIDYKIFCVFTEKYYICKDCIEQINKVKYEWKIYIMKILMSYIFV